MINKYKQIVYFTFLIVIGYASGQSIQEAQKLKAEYDRLNNSQEQFNALNNADIDNIDPVTGLPTQAKITPYIFEDDDLLKEEEDVLKHFGYDFFTRRDTVSFWENLPTPSNYQLGPGDELVISLWGETQLRETYTVSREGKIYDSKVGLLNITGKDINEARIYLKDQFGRIYATLKGSRPSSFIDVSLGELRSINVNFVGEVEFPGVYPVHPFSNVITGLIQAGGVDTSGSLRNIKLKRNGKLINNVDLYSYLLKGESPQNIQLRDQDIIVVPVRASIVEVDSAVTNPGIYEGIIGETIFDLIKYAGGLSFDADDKIGLRRVKPIKDRDLNGVYEGSYINIKLAKQLPVQSGDRIEVHYILDEDQYVEIIGQVKNPGTYNFYNNMTLKSLFELGAGFEDSTFWKSVYHQQAEIIRRDPTSRYEQVIKINLSEIYSTNSKNDIILQNLDRVVIHANLNYFEKDNIYISGEVNIPGAYPLISDKETLKSILGRAGDLTPKALKNGISIYRDSKYFEVVDPPVIEIKTNVDEDNQVKKDDTNKKVRVAWQNESIALMPGDSIVVKETTGTVNVTGEVYNKGLIEFRRGKSLNYYINAAGGVTDLGNKNNIIVIYTNGLVGPKKWYTSPRVDEGSTIIVNRKPIEEPFNVTEFAGTFASLLSSMVTIIVLSQQL